MFNSLFKAYRLLVQMFCLPIFLSDFFNKETGKEYSVGFFAKFALVLKMIRNNTKIVSGSSFLEHLTMATALLKIPKALEGVVVECGTYKGVSAANLSLVCKLCQRTLEIFDSFEGLPEPSQQDQAHTLLSTREIHTYTRGSWCGTLAEVQQNIAKYGIFEVCHFHKGYFETTLSQLNKKCVFIWLDVDYRDSLETCLKHLWPLLENGCPLYTHEATHFEIASLFFSAEWWVQNLGTSPPGLVGAGSGIGLKILSGSSFNSSLGYTVKNPSPSAFQEVPQFGGLKLNARSALELTSGMMTTKSNKSHTGNRKLSKKYQNARSDHCST